MTVTVKIQQGGKGVVDWGNGISDEFEYPARSARQFLGIERENLDAKIHFTIPVDDEDAERLHIQAGILQYD